MPTSFWVAEDEILTKKSDPFQRRDLFSQLPKSHIFLFLPGNKARKHLEEGGKWESPKQKPARPLEVVSMLQILF